MRKSPAFVTSLVLLLSSTMVARAFAAPLLADLKLHEQDTLVKVVATPDMKHWAALVAFRSATAETGYQLHTDTGKKGPFREFDLHSLRFLADGKTLVFAAAVPEGDPEPGWYIHVGKTETGPFHFLSGIFVSTDGKILSFVERTGTGVFMLHIGKDVHGPYDNVTAAAHAGGVRSFMLRDARGTYLWAGNRKFGPYESVDSVTVTSRLEATAFRFAREGKTYLFDGKAEQGPFEDCIPPIVSPDGSAVAYAARTGAPWSVVFNGKRVGTHPSVTGSLFLTGDNARVVYWVKEKDSYYLMSATAKLGPYTAPGIVRFPPGKAILVYSAGLESSTYLFSGEGRLGPYPAVHDIGFSSDGKMLGWLTSDESGGVLRTRYGSVQRIKDFSGYDGGLATSVTGLEVAIAGSYPGGHAVWKGSVRYGPYPEAYSGLTYSPNGKLLEAVAPSSSESKLILENGLLVTGCFVRDARGVPVAAVWGERGKILHSFF